MDTSIPKIKVLWIDDNPTEFLEFLDDAFDEGIDIDKNKDVYKTVNAGLQALENRNNLYEAIILDANCKIENESESAHLKALSHAIVGLYKRGIDIPWFVYTGGGYEGKEGLRHIIPQEFRSWDEKIWYDKPDDEDELFAAIKKAVCNSKIYKLKHKFPEAFKLCPTQELADLLFKIEEQNFGRNEDVANKLRCILDSAICDYLLKHGIYARDKFASSNKIKECSLFFGEDKDYIYAPHHVQISFRFLSDFCNPASHGAEQTQKRPNKIRAEIMAGSAPYINITAINAAMSIFHWVASFDTENEEEMNPIKLFFSEIADRINEKEKAKKKSWQ